MAMEKEQNLHTEEQEHESDEIMVEMTGCGANAANNLYGFM